MDANLDGPESSTSALPLPANKEAHILLLSTISRAKLIFGDLESAKVDMDEAYKVLDDLEGVESSVRAAYYDVAAQYHKVCFIFILLIVFSDPTTVRVKVITRSITRTLFCILPVWISRRICPPKRDCRRLMISVLLHSWRTRSTILVNWCVSASEYQQP